MNVINEARTQIWQLIDRAKHDAEPSSIRNLRDLLVEAIDSVDKANRQMFHRGDRVSFLSRNGETLFCVIDRVNTKSATVTVIAPPDQLGRSWKVGLSLLTLTKLAPQNLKPISEEEAEVIAMRVCEEPGLDSEDFTAKHIGVRNGRHLIFVETPAHGYYVVVSGNGRPQIVGEEDAGISEVWVTRLFGVDRYGQGGENAAADA